VAIHKRKKRKKESERLLGIIFKKGEKRTMANGVWLSSLDLRGKSQYKTENQKEGWGREGEPGRV